MKHWISPQTLDAIVQSKCKMFKEAYAKLSQKRTLPRLCAQQAAVDATKSPQREAAVAFKAAVEAKRKKS